MRQSTQPDEGIAKRIDRAWERVGKRPSRVHARHRQWPLSDDPSAVTCKDCRRKLADKTIARLSKQETP